MPGHEDPEAVIIRAADGFLACKCVKNLKEDEAKDAVETESEDIEPDKKFIQNEVDWKTLKKKELDDYAAEQGIELDRRRSLKQMQQDFADALADRE